jgi:transposase
MAKKSRRKKIEVNLPELDSLLDSAENRPLKKAEADELRVAIHLMAERIQSEYRSSEKAKDVLNEKQKPAPTPDPQKGEKKKPNKRGGGHGHQGAAVFIGAEKLDVPHETMQHGCRCPECASGNVYTQKEPRTLVRIVGQMPFQGKVYNLERLRCNRCGEVFTAEAPKGVGPEKYDESVTSMVALLKYGNGVAFNRIEVLQNQAGVPLPSSNQWDLIRDGALLLTPVHEELIRQAASGELVQNDDTSVRILELDRPDDTRTGVFTTGIVATKGEHKIALFESGWKYSGENLDDVLAERAKGLPTVIQMCDALPLNKPKTFSEGAEILLANCLAHGRRYFVDIVGSFPDQCRHVIEELGQVYLIDKQAKIEKLDPKARLKLHQTESEPRMKQLHQWLLDELEEKRAEPNSPLGRAIQYMLTHWKALTLFLRVPGAPLDNNIVERALKKAILHRKNSLFYRSENGANAGDLFMSLIHTCELNHLGPHDYILQLLRHPLELQRSPGDWLPWNYLATLASINSHAAPD